MKRLLFLIFAVLIAVTPLTACDTMAVDENYRGMGIGHHFFEMLKNLKKEKHFDGIELQVNAKNVAAYEMYKKYGFTEKSINMELL